MALDVLVDWFKQEIASGEITSRGYHSLGVEALLVRKDTERLMEHVATAIAQARAKGFNAGKAACEEAVQGAFKDRNRLMPIDIHVEDSIHAVTNPYQK